MKQTIQQFIESHQLFTTTDKLLVAVSGGIDSIVLVHSLQQLGHHLEIAHCNYQLRGEESDGDEAFVKQLAEALGIPLNIIHFDTERIANESNESIQMVARRLRYEWFEELLNQRGLDYVATAHHLNDSLETVLFNFTKGTGIAGLSGISAKVGRIVRPLLSSTKKDILEFAEANQLAWREDSSNDSTKYHRNKIRHKVLPVLKEINPNFEQTGFQTLQKLDAVQAIVDQEIYAFERRVIKEHPNDLSMPIPLLKKESHLGFKLFEALKKYGFNYSQITALAENLDRLTGKRFESPTHVLYIDRDRVLLVNQQQEITVEPIEISEETNTLQWWELYLELEQFPIEDYRISKSAQNAGLDLNQLKFPLTLRFWEQGDYFCPLGMKGKKKKISDFLIDEKIPLHQKERIAVIQSGDDIVWVVGYRLDDRFKITENTKQVLAISIVAES